VPQLHVFCSGMSSDGHLTCVDTWQNDAMAEGRRSTFEEFKKNTDKFSRIITPVRGKSIDAINGIAIPLHSLDFLFIDGDHSYESVRQDFLLYSKLIRNGGLLIFHDYACDDVKKVITENVMQFVTESDYLPNLWWGKFTSNA
jgi:predicted O-methyltransferase YrrM